MPYKLLGLITLPLVLFSLVLPGVALDHVAACSPIAPSGRPPTLFETIEAAYKAEPVVAIALAEIVEVRGLTAGERTIPHALDPSGASGVEILDERASDATFQAYVFWSDSEFAGNVVGPLGFSDPSCYTAPQLEVGDRLLLFLQRPFRSKSANYSLGGTLLFRGDTAYAVSTSRDLVAIGSTREVIEYLLSIAGSPETTSGPAREFVGLAP